MYTRYNNDLHLVRPLFNLQLVRRPLNVHFFLPKPDNTLHSKIQESIQQSKLQFLLHFRAEMLEEIIIYHEYTCALQQWKRLFGRTFPQRRVYARLGHGLLD